MTTNSDASQAVELPDFSDLHEAITQYGQTPPSAEKGRKRAVILASVRLMLDDHAAAAIAQDRAARAQAEPVAWQERQTVAPGRWSDWYECKGHPTTPPFSRESGGITYEWRPVYAAPTIPQAAEVPDDWRPIATAPTTGTILLWWKNAGAVTGSFAIDEDWNRGSSTPREGWKGDGDECIPRNQEDCTHWQLLRAPVGNPWPRFDGQHCTQEWLESRYSAAPTPTASAPKPAQGDRDFAFMRFPELYPGAPKAEGEAEKPAETPPLSDHDRLALAIAAAKYATQPPSEADRTREGGDVVAMRCCLLEPGHEGRCLYAGG